MITQIFLGEKKINFLVETCVGQSAQIIIKRCFDSMTAFRKAYTLSAFDCQGIISIFQEALTIFPPPKTASKLTSPLKYNMVFFLGTWMYGMASPMLNLRQVICVFVIRGQWRPGRMSKKRPKNPIPVFRSQTRCFPGSMARKCGMLIRKLARTACI